MLDTPVRFAVRPSVAAVALALLVGCSAADSGSSDPTTADGAGAPAHRAEFDRLEEDFDTRLGVYALDTATGEEVNYSSDERFPYTSAFKPLACGAVLADRTVDRMDEIVTFDEEDLVPHSPITEEHLDTGISLRESCDAAIRHSDNTAANLLFQELGGPEGLQEALRAIGDRTTQVDRTEVELNEAVPGDTQDTSTPEQLATDLREYVFGDALEPEKQALLEEMLRQNTTGDDTIRAGVPDDWEVGDKTGAGEYGTRNSIGILWPPHEEPIMIAVMSTREVEGSEYDDALIAEATEVVVEAMAQ